VTGSQRIEKTNTLGACCIEKFASPRADRDERIAMIDPGDAKRSAEQDLKLQ